MKYFLRIAFCCLITFFLISCKNDTKEAPESNTSNEKPFVKPAEKKTLNQEEKAQVSSVLAKAMTTSELKKFVSLMVTAGVADMLAKQKGPFTIIAPSNEAFDNVAKNKYDALLNPKNKADLEKFVKSHIIEGSLDSSTLLQNIKSGNGSYKIITMTGITYTATKEGDDIIITDVHGMKATLGKSDISGSNGILHVINRALSVP